ncbi:MAG: GDSL-type esterase/lipase family protein [Saprospiraceae bacterium]
MPSELMFTMMKSPLLLVSLLINVLLIGAVLFALQRYGGWRNLWSKINNRGVEKTYFHRKNLFEMLPVKDGAIIFLGNSITAQNEWAEMFGNPDIINRGIPGDHCDGIRGRLGAVLKNQPAKIFLMAGINDLAFYPPEKVLTKYERLVEAILTKTPSTKLYLQSVLPVNNIVSPTPVDNDDIRTLNDGIRRLAVAKGVVFIDLYPILLDADGNLDAAYTQDGVHLNGAAYLKWKDAIEEFVGR